MQAFMKCLGTQDSEIMSTFFLNVGLRRSCSTGTYFDLVASHYFDFDVLI